MSVAAPPRLQSPPGDEASFAAQTGATAAQTGDLLRFRDLLEDWNRRVNLVSDASLAEFWPRHAFDSAQILPLAPAARVWADIGAGAGLPGVVLAILLKETPGARVYLVESQARRCRFLEAAVEALGLPAVVCNARAEDLSLRVDAVTARAVAPLVKLLGFARPLLAAGAVGFFLKGRNAEAELAEARGAWRFRCEIIASRSDVAGRILKVEGIARVR